MALGNTTIGDSRVSWATVWGQEHSIFPSRKQRGPIERHAWKYRVRIIYQGLYVLYVNKENSRIQMHLGMAALTPARGK